jgi:hypothetical protein
MNTWTRYLNKFLGLFPAPLPQGVPAFEEWVDALMSTYSLPTSSKDDVKFVIAGEILRFGPLKHRCSKYRMVRAIRAVAAKQIAGNAFQEIKQRQFAAQKAANEVQPQ